MSTEAAAFVELFSRLWAGRDPQRFPELFHEGGGFTHPGLGKVARHEIPDYWQRVFSLVPDLCVEVTGWASRGDVLYIEEMISGTVAGHRLEWPGVLRFVLRGDRAVEAVAHWDSFPLWAALDPSLRGRNLLATAAAEPSTAGTTDA